MAMDEEAPTLDATILPIYQQWKRNGEWLSLWDYATMRGDPDLAAAFSKLFWPDFVEVEGCVFLEERYRRASFAEWDTLFQGDRQRIEAMINHTHIYDLFLNTGAEVTYSLELYEYLAQVLIVTWKHALQTAFPTKSFTFEYGTEPNEYGPTVTFYQSP